MSIALAATFHPRGETARLARFYPQLQAVYSAIIISLPPTAATHEIEACQALGAHVFVNVAWAGGRWRALAAGLETKADFIHYADLDRLIRWVETRPDEWRAAVERIRQTDCLVIGRTNAAWATHPEAMTQVERVVNAAFAPTFGPGFDLCIGSRGFSRRAAAFVIANSEPKRAIGADVEWPALCWRAGYRVHSLLVDGMDWEIPDQHQEHAADAIRQRQVAAAYDADPAHWAHRAETTLEAVEAGFEALARRLRRPSGERVIEFRRHTMRLKPGQHLSRAGVELARRVGAQMGPFDRVITSTVPRAYETAVAMGFAADEQLEALAEIGEGVEAEVAWDAGFAAFARAFHQGQHTARYGLRLAEFLRSVAAALPDGGAALVVAHGGMMEAAAVACLPDADHAAWGSACSWCEGVRLIFDGERFVSAEILRVGR
jgi:broad specificity phosphatase PhoE